jgi:hypothetical protein
MRFADGNDVTATSIRIIFESRAGSSIFISSKILGVALNGISRQHSHHDLLIVTATPGSRRRVIRSDGMNS